MLDDRILIRACSAPWSNGVELLVRQGDMVGVNVAMKSIDPNVHAKPTMTIGIDGAQTLMDDLWQAGFRPTEGSGSAGSLRATEKHLKDMRQIAFKKLGIDN